MIARCCVAAVWGLLGCCAWRLCCLLCAAVCCGLHSAVCCLLLCAALPSQDFNVLNYKQGQHYNAHMVGLCIHRGTALPHRLRGMHWHRH